MRWCLVLKTVLDRILGRVLVDARECLVLGALAAKEDLVSSGLMPFESGFLQNSATYVDVGGLRQDRASLVSDTVYARRKFFHPEFEFDQSVNRQAGGRWFDAYLNGDRRDLFFDEFAGEMRKKMKG